MGEAENEGQPVVSAPARPKRRMSRLSRWLLWIGAVLLLLAAIVAGIAAYLFHRAEPMLRASLIDTLQERFHARVELDDLRVSALDGFWVEGRGLRIWLPTEALAEDDPTGQAPWRTQPWIVVGKLKFHATWQVLSGKPIEVSVIHVEDARILVPPKDDRPHISLSGSASSDGKTGTAQASPGTAQPGPVAPEQPANSSLFKMPQIEVHQIECQNAQLVIERKQVPGKPAKIPLNFELRKITLIPDGKGGPVAFLVDMVNAKPIGTIHSKGHLGPWVPGDPGSLPVDGSYSFDHADLSTIKGIAGMLSSTGHYSGTLRRIETDGQTETPDFRLERVRNETGVRLTTHFHAVVDGTNGDTWLQPVDAVLGRTHFTARGQVVRAEDLVPGTHGHDIKLQVTMNRGRIDDILLIAADADKPFVTGDLTLNTSFHLPPNPPSGDVSVWDRLLLDGQFHLSEARFNNETMQERITQLSLRGQGKPGEVKSTDPASVLSEAQGHFKLGNGILQLPDLAYQVPGAEILAHGTYGLQGGTLDFEGDARLDASLSKVVGGWKGFLLKPADRYLRKNGAGTDVPIHVNGTRKEPKFGVDFGRLGKTEETPQAAPQ